MLSYFWNDLVPRLPSQKYALSFNNHHFNPLKRDSFLLTLATTIDHLTSNFLSFLRHGSYFTRGINNSPPPKYTITSKSVQKFERVSMVLGVPSLALLISAIYSGLILFHILQLPPTIMGDIIESFKNKHFDSLMYTRKSLSYLVFQGYTLLRHALRIMPVLGILLVLIMDIAKIALEDLVHDLRLWWKE